MMKYLYGLIGLFILNGALKAQVPPRDSLTGKFLYKGVVLMDSSVSRADLFTRAAKWFDEKYKIPSPDTVGQTDGTRSRKGSFPITFAANGYTHEIIILYRVGISVKNGAYTYEITDFQTAPDRISKNLNQSFEKYDANPVTEEDVNKKVKAQIFNKTDTEIKKMILEIKSAMSGVSKK